MTTNHPAEDSQTPHANLRAMLASTPPPPTSLWATGGEDEAVRVLREHGHFTLPRFDTDTARSLRTRTDIATVHLGAIRLYDRGIITLSNDHPPTATHATWTWNGHHGESKGLRLQRWRTLSYLPYQVGHYALTPEDSMTGPLMAAVLAWHHAHTGITRLDLHLNPTSNRISPAFPDGWAVEITAHGHDGTIHRRTVTNETANQTVPTTRSRYDEAEVDDFAVALRRNAHPHQQPLPHNRLHPAHEARLLHALCTRIAPTLYDGATAITVDTNTWLLHPHPNPHPNPHPSQHAETTVHAKPVPLDVQDALAVLGAPALTIADPTAARRYATTNARVTFGCKGSSDGETTWKHRHILQVTSTGGVALLDPRDREVRRRSDADHMLAALNGRPAPCTRLARVLDGTNPASIRGTLTRLRISTPATADRLEAAHRVARWLRNPHDWPLPEHKR